MVVAKVKKKKKGRIYNVKKNDAARRGPCSEVQLPSFAKNDALGRQAKTKNRGVNEIWTDAVTRAAAAAASGTAPKAISGHLARMGDLGNVPRQEKKFKVHTTNYVVFFFPRIATCCGEKQRLRSLSAVCLCARQG